MAFQAGDRIKTSKLGTLVVSRLISSGQFAESYLARSGRKQYFLKKYTEPSTLFSPWYAEYSKYQGEVLNRISKPIYNQWIVPVLDVFVFDDFYCQAHEWIQGQDLEQYFSTLKPEKWLDLKAATEFACSLLTAVKAIHAEGVVHTDLKPANLAIHSTKDNKHHLRVTDFDWSLIEGRNHPWDGTVRGTPFYMSYEHLSSVPPTVMSDIFTCGIILYELFTGKNPMIAIMPPGDHSLSEINGRLRVKIEDHRSIPKPTDFDPGCQLWPKASQAIYKCLSMDPQDRPTAHDLLDALTKRETRLILKHANGLELRTSRSEVESRNCYLGRERCRMFDNYKEISRLHAWLMPSKDYSKWFAVPPSKPSTNILTIEHEGREEDFRNGNTQLHTGDRIRIRGIKNRNHIVCEWVVNIEPT